MTTRSSPPRSLWARAASNLLFARELISRQLEASFALRGAFWTAALLMLVNDLIYCSTWWILMRRFGNIGGWNLDDVLCLYAISAAGFGLCVILAGGIHDLSRRIDEGDLDAVLTQPKSVLIQTLGSRTQPSGWGDLSVAALFLSLSDAVHWQTLPALCVAVGCAAVTFVACGVVMHSLAFWFGRTQTLSRALWEFTLLFSLYPPAVFGAGIRFVLFTLLPAALVSFLPVELVRHPSWGALGCAVGGTAAYAGFAIWFFERGLRRYASGNRFVVRG
jgi:ABC-2 type transport system permease protein